MHSGSRVSAAKRHVSILGASQPSSCSLAGSMFRTLHMGPPRGDSPYWSQSSDRTSRVLISRGVWMAQGAVVMPGIDMGEVDIIGLNSVVSRGVPDGCIAFGAPARVVKRRHAGDERCRPVAAKVGDEDEAR
jgi:acetyltransferase-like isoleucine patch superfamily enzyme